MHYNATFDSFVHLLSNLQGITFGLVCQTRIQNKLTDWLTVAFCYPSPNVLFFPRVSFFYFVAFVS